MLTIPSQKLKDFLVKDGLITSDNFDVIEKEASRLNQNLSEVLVSRGVLSTDYLYSLLSNYLGVEPVNLSANPIDENVLMKISEKLARQKKVVLFKEEAGGVYDAAMEDPSDLKTIDFLENSLNAKIKPFLARPADLERGFAIYNRQSSADFQKIIEENIKTSLSIKEDKIEKIAREMPIVAIVENFIAYASATRASDIHIEALEDMVLVRFRIDGVLHEIAKIPKDVHPAILARVKLLAALKLDEHYKPQDGRFRYQLSESVLDLRVSIIPTFYGEKIVLRLLPAAQKPLALEEVGMLEDTVKIVKENIVKTYGMILVCGPTGSGKTTTIYSILNMLNKPEVNIVTIEDPIEYSVKYINQTQVNVLAGVTFANGLRSILRQDPNIIGVGEIRDEETAEIAVHAALTGHLVLSSLHTNDAPTTIPRLIDMKIPPFLIAAVLNLIIAQRLVRKICANCVESYSTPADLLKNLEKLKSESNLSTEYQIPKTLFRGKGCNVCANTGYRGRMGIYEVMQIDNEIRAEMAKADFSLTNLTNLARRKGMITMFEDGLRKAALGLTSVEEVMRVIREE